MASRRPIAWPSSVARDVRLDQGAGPGSVKIGLAGEGYGQSRDAGFAVAIEAEAAQHGIELRQVVRMKIDGERRTGWSAGRRPARHALQCRSRAGAVPVCAGRRRRCAACRWRRWRRWSGASPGGVCRDGLKPKFAVTETVRTSPFVQVAAAGPFRGRRIRDAVRAAG